MERVELDYSSEYSAQLYEHMMFRCAQLFAVSFSFTASCVRRSSIPDEIVKVARFWLYMLHIING